MPKPKNLTLTDIIEGYKSGDVSYDEAVTYLSQLGYDQSEANVILKVRTRPKVASEATPPQISSIDVGGGESIPVLAWGKLSQDVVDRFGMKSVRTLWTPIFSMDFTSKGYAPYSYKNIYATYEDGSAPELASDEDKAKIDPNQVQGISVLSSLETSAIKNNILTADDIASNVALRTVMGDMVKQWGQGLNVDPLEQLGRIKKYMPDVSMTGKGDPQSRDYQRIQQAQIDLARNIASVPADKVEEFAATGLANVKKLETDLATMRAGVLNRPSPQVQGIVESYYKQRAEAPPVTSQELSAAIRQSQPGTEQPALPAALEPDVLKGSAFATGDLSKPEGMSASSYGALDVAGAANAEGERRRKLREKAQAKWLDLVEQARNQIQQNQRKVAF